MKTFLFLALAFTLVAGHSWADNKSAAKTTTPTPTGTPTMVTSPTPTRTPMMAPTWAPMEASADTYHAPPKNKGKSKWGTLLNIGAAVPYTSHFQADYGTGFSVDIGSTYQFSERFAGLLDISVDHFDSSNTAVTGDINYTMVGLGLLARVSLFTKGLSPFLFAGPGLMYNENRANNATAYDPYTGYTYFPINGYEIDFMGEGGLGLEYKSPDGFTLFLQGKFVADFVSPAFAASTATDSPLFFIPVQAGFAIGL